MSTKDTLLDLPDYAAKAGAGYENVTTDDMKIPFLTILQALSPQVMKKNDKYVDGAEAGMVLETVSGKVYDTDKKPLLVIPCGFKKAFVEWVPRELGGGFVKMHTDSSILSEARKGQGDKETRDFLPNGNLLVTTTYHSVLLIDEDSVKPCLISMTYTQLKHSRSWMTLMTSLKMKGKDGKSFTPPMYAYHWKLSTVSESNSKGTFYSWRFTLGDLVRSQDSFQSAEQLSLSVSKTLPALGAPQQEHDIEIM